MALAKTMKTEDEVSGAMEIFFKTSSSKIATSRLILEEEISKILSLL